MNSLNTCTKLKFYNEDQRDSTQMEGWMPVDKIFLTQLISTLTKSWNHITQPVDLKETVILTEIVSVIRNKVTKKKNRSTSQFITFPSSTKSSKSSTVKKKRFKRESRQADRDTKECDNFKEYHRGVCSEKEADTMKPLTQSLEIKLKGF